MFNHVLTAGRESSDSAWSSSVFKWGRVFHSGTWVSCGCSEMSFKHEIASLTSHIQCQFLVPLGEVWSQRLCINFVLPVKYRLATLCGVK